MTKAEQAKLKADKAKFDKIAAHKMCLRCQATGAACCVVVKVSTSVAVLNHRYWLCRDCASSQSQHLVEVRVARKLEDQVGFRELLSRFGVGPGAATENQE